MDAKLYKTYESVENDHWWFLGRRKIILGLLKKYGYTKESKILDFGCNTGLLVHTLNTIGYDAYGCDISDSAIAFGRAKGVKNLSVESIPLSVSDNSFDVVLALDVIEHIEDDEGALNELARVTKAGGRIFIMVPAFMFMWGLQDVVAHHYRRYRRAELVALANKANLTIERISYFNFFLFLPVAIIRLIQKVIVPKRASDFELNNKFTNFILSKLFKFEASILSKINFPFGVSLLAVLRKND